MVRLARNLEVPVPKIDALPKRFQLIEITSNRWKSVYLPELG